MPQSHDSVPTHPADIRVDFEGEHFLLTPITGAARAWLEENLASETPWRGGSAEIRGNEVNALINRMTDAALVVSGPM